jgi:hypothetical protein
MPLKDEKIQDNRIRPTPEIGCRATYPAPPAFMLVRRMPRADAAPRSGNGGVTVTAATRVDCEGAEHVHLLTIHGERGAGWLGIDFCGTPLIPSDARGHATCVSLPCLIASPRRLRPKRSSQGFRLNVRVPGTRRVPLAGPHPYTGYRLAPPCANLTQ